MNPKKKKVFIQLILKLKKRESKLYEDQKCLYRLEQMTAYI